VSSSCCLYITLPKKYAIKILGKNFKRMARENFTMLGRLFEILLLVGKQLGIIGKPENLGIHLKMR
jgi:hypothetical protein